MNGRAHLLIGGRVQGVFFRSFTQENAEELGLTGWVRNLRDGRVEVVVEGDREKIMRLIDRLRRGPPLAKVESVEVEWEDYRGEFRDFRIVY